MTGKKNQSTTKCLYEKDDACIVNNQLTSLHTLQLQWSLPSHIFQVGQLSNPQGIHLAIGSFLLASGGSCSASTQGEW